MSKSSALVAVISCLLALSTFAASAQQQWPALTLNDQTVGGLR